MTDFVFRNYDAWKTTPPDGELTCSDCEGWLKPDHVFGVSCECMKCSDCGRIYLCRGCYLTEAAGL